MKYTISLGSYNKEKYNYHSHKDYEIIYYPSGHGKLNIEDKFFDVEQGDIVVIPPHTKHGSISCDNLSYNSILGNSDGLIHLDKPVIFKDNQNKDGFSLLRLIAQNRFGQQEFFNALCVAYIHFVLKNIKITTPIESIVNNIKNQITASLHDSKFNVTSVLNQCGYAEDYIRAHFKKIVGKTPVEFLNELRIKDAITLIKIYHSTMSLMDIATSCGFDDYIYFSRKFKHIMGVSPQNYKNTLFVTKQNS